MPDLVSQMPLYAFVELKIDNNIITNLEDGYLYQDDNGYGNMSYGFGEDNSKMVIGLSVVREGINGGLMQSFTLSLFDDTAIYAEAIVANAFANAGATQNVELEYGWSSKGKKISGRTFSFAGKITEYQLSFNGPSTSIEINGVGSEIIELAASGTETFDSQTYKGSPSEIVKKIADSHGWSYDDTTIIETQPITDSTNPNEPMTFLQGGRTEQAFINQDLVPQAYSLDGEGGYGFWVKDDENGNKVAYFKPEFPGSGATFDASIVDEHGGEEQMTNSPNTLDYSTEKAKCVRHYEYYTGNPSSEIISFTPEFDNVAGECQSPNVYSVDAAGEPMKSKVAGNGRNIDINGMKMIGSGSSKSRIMGISTLTYQRLEIAAKYLWSLYASQACTASMEIMGDPGIQHMDEIEIDVYTKYGFKHHTSGVYQVTSVEDSIDGGSFITTLELNRLPVDPNYSGSYNGFGEGTTEAPGAQSVSGGNADTKTSYPIPATTDWVKIALSQKGANEKDGTHAKYLQYVGLGSSYAWCAAFVSWCLGQAGVTSVVKTAQVQGFLDDARAKGKFKAKGYIPKAGDIFIQKSNGASHVGFVASVNGSAGTYTTIEGNSSDMVKSNVRSLSDASLTGFYVL